MKRKNSNKYLVLIILIAVTILISSVFLLFPENIQKIKTLLTEKYYGNSSQCVAYVQRFYKKRFNIEIKNVGRAMNLFSRAADYGLYAHENGSDVYPQPGDILVFGHRNKIGHVAIITDVTREGIKIIEQNWQGGAITTNNNQPIKMRVENGKYILEKRDNFYVIGWVSRTTHNPYNSFFFLNGESHGWIGDNNTFEVSESGIDNLSWEVWPAGKWPTVMSPVFLNPIPLSQIELVVKIIGNNIDGGVAYVRDEDNDWQELEFDFKNNEQNYQRHTINFQKAYPDLKATQVRLHFKGKPQWRKKKEIWSFKEIHLFP